MSVKAILHGQNYTKAEINELLDDVQDSLQFDDTPTANSSNPVKSGGIYTALSNKQDTLSFDNQPTNNSQRMLTSGSIYTALSGKQNTLTIANSVQQGNNNPVSSGAVYTAIQGLTPEGDLVVVDDELSSTSENPVQNKVIYTALADKASINDLTDYATTLSLTDGLATKAPTNHASSTTTYGVGTDTNYGHLKITDNATNTAATSGIAISPKAVYTLTQTVAGKQDTLSTTNPLPISSGGTGATTRLDAAKALANVAVASPEYVVGLTTGWNSFGYTSIEQLKTKLNIISVKQNLLDNWYFVGGGSQQGNGQLPINRRGQTSYLGRVYTIDRWVPTNSTSTVTLYQDYIELGGSGGGYWAQYIEWNKLKGKTVTYSILYLNDNNIVQLATGTGTLPTSVPSENQTIILLNSQFPHGGGDGLYIQNGKLFAQIGVPSGYTLRVIAAKLEIGDTQTLAYQKDGNWVLTEVPNYEEQMLRCQMTLADSTDPSTGISGERLVFGRLSDGIPYLRFHDINGDKYQLTQRDTKYFRYEKFDNATSTWTTLVDSAKAIQDLDVSATTFGTGETLSSISETDGKISVSKQNIAIGAGAITSGTLTVARGGTGQTTLKAAANSFISNLDVGSASDVVTTNHYIITSGTGTNSLNTFYRRSPSAVRVGGLTTARKLKVALGSTTDVTFDGTADQTSIPVSGALPIANGGTGATNRLDAARALTSENVGSANPGFVVALTSNWANFGHLSMSKLKEDCLGLYNLYSNTFTNKTTITLTVSSYPAHFLMIVNASQNLECLVFTKTAANSGALARLINPSVAVVNALNMETAGKISIIFNNGSTGWILSDRSFTIT